MDTDFMAALDLEIERLREALSRDVRFMRLRELERVRDLYRDPVAFITGQEQSLAGHRPDGPGESGEPRARTSARRSSPERQRALQAAKFYLSNRRGPVPTSEIYNHIVSLGVVIGGEEPRNNLSAMLSASGEFRSHGRNGWTLKSESEGSEPDEGSTDDRGAARADLDTVLGLGPKKTATPSAFTNDLDDDIPF